MSNPKPAWPLVLTSLLSVAAVAASRFGLGPFRRHTESDIALAYDLLPWSPYVVGALLAGSLLFGIRSWPGNSAWKRGLISLSVLVSAGGAWLGSTPMAQQMFKQTPPKYAPASDSGFDASDMVLGVVVGEHARAYPVRLVAYHHIVNDEMDGLPYVVTY